MRNEILIKEVAVCVCVLISYSIVVHNTIVNRHHVKIIQGSNMAATKTNNIINPSLEAARFYHDITFTNLGWFHPDKKTSLSYARTLTSRNLTDAVQSHRRFNFSAWVDLEEHPDTYGSRPIVAFLDVETCFDPNWPSFGPDFTSASDTAGGRKRVMPMVPGPICEAIQTALQSPALRAADSRLVMLACGHTSFKIEHCIAANNSKLVVAHLSAHKDEARPQDIGIAPLPMKSVDLTAVELHDIENCQNRNRTHFFSFTGRQRVPFLEFTKYFESVNKIEDDVFVKFHRKHYDKSNKIPASDQATDMYYRLLRNSVFAGSPRGDCLFSFRFSEILSAGTIPVVYADGWVLPFTKDIVDWKDAAVLLPQDSVNQTMDLLRNYTPQKICKMSQNALYIYNNFVKDSHARLRGILRVLDSRLAAKNGAYEVFSAMPGNRKSDFRKC